MKCPPYLVKMRVEERQRIKFRLWLPVFILWPLLLVLLLLTLVATLFADLASLAAGHRPGYTRLLFGVLGVVGETRGTEVFIQDKSHASRTVAFTVL
jgi:hypothetical protein